MNNMLAGSRCGDSLADGWMACRPEITCPHRCLRLANYLKLPRMYSLGTRLVFAWYSRVTLVVLTWYSLAICLFLSWTRTQESWCPLGFFWYSLGTSPPLWKYLSGISAPTTLADPLWQFPGSVVVSAYMCSNRGRLHVRAYPQHYNLSRLIG